MFVQHGAHRATHFVAIRRQNAVVIPQTRRIHLERLFNGRFAYVALVAMVLGSVRFQMWPDAAQRATHQQTR